MEGLRKHTYNKQCAHYERKKWGFFYLTDQKMANPGTFRRGYTVYSNNPKLYSLLHKEH